MGCFTSKIYYNTIRWVEDNTIININKIDEISKNIKWNYIIFSNSPFYYLFNKTLDELIDYVDDNYKKELNKLKCYSTKEINTISLIPTIDDIKKKLKEGNVLHIKYNKTNIEYTLYINQQNGNNIKLTY